MEFISSVFNSYSQFLDLNVIVSELSQPSSWAIIFTLMILEGLLSADNALVLAMMVKHLPGKEQKKALTYGIWGAYLFRFIAIGIGTYLIKIWWVKLLAAGYLAKMVFDYFRNKDSNDDGINNIVQKGFWSTIASVELMDIAFSIDSITAAFGISSKVWVLFLGAIFGIIMMRGVAQVFVNLIEKVPELETSAYILIGLISAKMILGVAHIEVPDLAFFGLLIAVFSGTFVVHNIKK